MRIAAYDGTAQIALSAIPSCTSCSAPVIELDMTSRPSRNEARVGHFAPGYRLLLQRAVQKDEPFGIVLIKAGPEVGGAAEPHRVGTTARVIGTTPLPGGRSFIIARGERRFEIERVDADSEPYLVGRV